MFIKELSSRFLIHIPSSVVALLFIVHYIYGNHVWLEEFLPVKGKFLASFTLVSLVVLYELVSYHISNLKDNILDLTTKMEIASFRASVNQLYQNFIDSREEFLTNEYTIRELTFLNDERQRLKVNSYIEDKINFLQNKVKRT